MRIYHAAVLALALVLAGCGGGGSGPSIGGSPDQVVLTGGGARVVITRHETIEQLVEAVGKAVPDEARYMSTLGDGMEFLAGGTSLLKLKFSGGLLMAGEKQYVDTEGQIGRIAGAMLECKAPLHGELDYPWKTPVSKSVKLKYTVSNAGDKPLTLETTFRAEFEFLQIPGRELKDEHYVPARTPAKLRGFIKVKGKEPVLLAPGASHVFELTLPLSKLEPGEKAMSVRFGKIKPSGEGEESDAPPTEPQKNYPPPIIGMLLTVQ